MPNLTLIFRSIAAAMLLLAQSGCVSSQAREFKRWAADYRSRDVEKEVAGRMAQDDFRFKSWREFANADTVYLPGISEHQVRRLSAMGRIASEELYWGDLQPFLVGNRQAYDDMLEAMYAYMLRFNQALFRRLDELGRREEAPDASNSQSKDDGCPIAGN